MAVGYIENMRSESLVVELSENEDAQTHRAAEDAPSRPVSDEYVQTRSRFAPKQFFSKITFLHRVFPLSSILIPAPYFVCSFHQRLWMYIAQLFGILVPMAMSVALLTPIYMIAVSFVGLMPGDETKSRWAIGACLAIWTTCVLILGVALVPILSRSFGYRMRNIMFRFWKFPDSMADLFFEMRCTIGLLILCPLVTAVTSFFFLDSHATDWGPVETWNPVLVLSGLMVCAGVSVLVMGNQAFLQSRGRRIRCWMSACWRGVALRNFIPEWDNQMRPIFESCRASRRFARAYRSIKIGAAGCFAAGGCLSATTVGESFGGIALTLLSMLCVFSLWPTANKIVDWTKEIMDPITAGE